MEFVLFWGGAFVLAVYLIWRVRRGTSTGPETLTKGLPDDLRDKGTGSTAITHGGGVGGHVGGGGGDGGGSAGGGG
jgi:hypothetical protein